MANEIVPGGTFVYQDSGILGTSNTLSRGKRKKAKVGSRLVGSLSRVECHQ
jgi:hypothetical protein